jgi:hypothetical protein
MDAAPPGTALRGEVVRAGAGIVHRNRVRPSIALRAKAIE